MDINEIFYYNNYLWLRVAKSMGSLKRLKQGKPRYGPSPFSLIGSLLLKDLSFSLIKIREISPKSKGGIATKLLMSPLLITVEG